MLNPELYNFELSERIACSDAEKDRCAKLVSVMADLAEKARADGIDSIQKHADNPKLPVLLREAIRMMPQVAEPRDLRLALEERIGEGDRGPALLTKLIIMWGSTLLIRGDHPDNIRLVLSAFFGEEYAPRLIGTDEDHGASAEDAHAEPAVVFAAPGMGVAADREEAWAPSNAFVDAEVRECTTFPEDMPWEKCLAIACYLMDHSAIRTFLDQGGDPSIRDEDGNTPIEALAAHWFDADAGMEVTRVKEMCGIRMERIVGPDDAKECAFLLLDAGARVTRSVGEAAKENSQLNGGPKKELIRLLRECLTSRKNGTPFERWWEIPAPGSSKETSGSKVMSEDRIDDLLAAFSSDSPGPFAHAEELFAEGEFLEAIDAYLAAIEKAGDNAAAYNNIGLSYLNLEEYDQAMKYFKRSLRVDPDYATALVNQACVYKRMGEINKAIAVSVEALARGETGDVLYNLACYTAIKGDGKTALSYLRRAIRRDERFREMAGDDEDFESISDSKDFRKLVG